MFPHCTIPEYSWAFPNGKMHNQIDHVLTDNSWCSIIVLVQPFRATDCDIDHYLVLAEVRERLPVSK
jgi:hypothetical protein